MLVGWGATRRVLQPSPALRLTPWGGERRGLSRRRAELSLLLWALSLQCGPAEPRLLPLATALTRLAAWGRYAYSDQGDL